MTEDVSDDGSFFNRWSTRKRRQSQQAGHTRDGRVLDAVDVDKSDGYAEPDEQVFNADNSLGPTAAASDFPTTVVTDDEQVCAAADEQQVAASADIGASGNSEEAPLLTDSDMPPLESLTANSDMSAFFNRGVSAVLRRAALRHVFHQPVFNVRDGLNDYDGDYTVFEPLGDTITSDMKWHTARKERERLEAQAREEEQREHECLEQEQQQTSEERGTEADAQDTETQDSDAPVSDAPESDAPESHTQRLSNKEPAKQPLVDSESYAPQLDNQDLDDRESDDQDFSEQDSGEQDSGEQDSEKLSDQSSGAEMKERDT